MLKSGLGEVRAELPVPVALLHNHAEIRAGYTEAVPALGNHYVSIPHQLTWAYDLLRTPLNASVAAQSWWMRLNADWMHAYLER
jgi:hypothetical protein